MRPEYIDAINSVRWGWSFWFALIAPAALIWAAAVRCIRMRVRIVYFAAAIGLFWAMAVFHSNHIQHAKQLNMLTTAEWDDWGSDTWNVFAPITAAVYAVAYCTVNAALAMLVVLPIRWWRDRQRANFNAA